MPRPSSRTRLGLVFAVAMASAAWAADPGAVSVRYDHPENFTETREVRTYASSEAGLGYLDNFARYIERRAQPVLDPNQRLEIVITDLDRAGSYLPSVGSPHPVRIVKDLYPPRIQLRFRLLDGQGQVVREGERTLTDLSFLQDGAISGTSTDPLRYEKRLIDRWLKRGAAGL